ncbi:hypothetical protein DPMN_029266 [Dreissena polymorpha]|uniref:Uncharacterized protein n=1 Tax=Dreissena polymorpha TaxID=45954 RepID=A0A9D4LYU0_DREPO|nr:hypothetical protein DPMN_029266 [Dreissena polymorpha]
MPRPLGAHVFQPTGTIFELIQDIIGTNVLTEFHEDRVLTRKNSLPPDIIGTNLLNKFLTRKHASPPGGYVSQPYGIIFELFHEDGTINVASRVLTRKNAPPLGSLVFQAYVTIFELIQYIIETNFLTKFHEDWK